MAPLLRQSNNGVSYGGRLVPLHVVAAASCFTLLLCHGM